MNLKNSGSKLDINQLLTVFYELNLVGFKLLSTLLMFSYKQQLSIAVFLTIFD